MDPSPLRARVQPACTSSPACAHADARLCAPSPTYVRARPSLLACRVELVRAAPSLCAPRRACVRRAHLCVPSPACARRAQLACGPGLRAYRISFPCATPLHACLETSCRRASFGHPAAARRSGTPQPCVIQTSQHPCPFIPIRAQISHRFSVLETVRLPNSAVGRRVAAPACGPVVQWEHN